MEIPNICRICLRQEDIDEMINFLLDKEDAAKIFNISGVQVKQENDQPNLICYECRNDLNNANEFRNKCLKADEFFRKSKILKLEIDCDTSVRVYSIDDITTSTQDLKQETVIDYYEEETLFVPSEKKRKGRRKRDKAKSSTVNSCSECLKTFSNQNYLKKHRYFCHSVIPVERLLVCDHCGLQTKTKQLIRNHITVAHSTKPKKKFICKICGKMLSTKGNLESHEKTHSFMDPSEYIPCSVCKKLFREKRFMIEHLKLVHEKSKRFQCPHCPHISTCKGAYNTHYKSVHLKCRDFICTDCGLGFSTNSQLTRHYRIHSGKRPFECKSCAKSFRLSSHRKRHEDICVKRVKNVKDE